MAAPGQRRPADGLVTFSDQAGAFWEPERSSSTTDKGLLRATIVGP
jgi:hypothetical protein